MTATERHEASPVIVSRSPLSWTAIRDLFLRPTVFFRSVNLGQGRAWLAAIWIVGIATTTSRIDQNLVRADLGRPRPGWQAVGPYLTESWTGFWVFVLAIGAPSAAVIWYVGGWWYNVRLRWCGARDFDRREARLVYTFAGVVAALPSLAYALSATALFPDYQAAWNAQEAWSALLLAFPFWSVVVSYKGIRTKFAVRATPARVWFLALPMLLYALALGVIGVLYAFLVPEAGRAVA